ncbi:MAG TPA: type 1 glutamine amidotransferase domain-containing protein [Alphaproteobacteria bacterium]|nr:type 1 glutamine amidotransferase domain-containing protein [Alphaproteobacteria bacterium]
MAGNLTGKHVAIVATDGFEQSELTQPLDALRAAGAKVDVISPKDGAIQGMQHHEKGDKITVDRKLGTVKPDAYDALVLPGGVANPDSLRIDKDATSFIQHFVDAGKPIAAICHGPWTLIESGFVRGKRMTSWPSLKTDLTNAGADWVDEKVVRDGTLVTSRKPDDLPAFCKEVIAMIAEDHAIAAE